MAGGTPGTSVQATFAATLVDQWVAEGVTDAVVCPGSRSTPLAVALAERRELRLHVRLDERGAGFFALGVGLATRRPAVVCTTSGTAAVELHPAVVEAHYAGVPLIVCTADRPLELHGIGAPQTIDQAGLYGAVVGWSADPGLPDAACASTWRPLAARAVREARGGSRGPGPVHLNLAFAEPLVGEPGTPPMAIGDGRDGAERRDADADADAEEALAADAERWVGRRGIVVAGADGGDPGAVLALAERLGWPVLADPRSGCRRAHPNVVAAADELVRVPTVRTGLLPEVAVVLGRAWSSRVVAEWLAELTASGVGVVAADPWWRWVDPSRPFASRPVDAARWNAALGDVGVGPVRSAQWLGRWQAAESAAQAAVDAELRDDSVAHGWRLSEPLVARLVPGAVGPDGWIVVASSMPVRDLESYGPVLADPPTVVANRGASGIDGVTSTALGVAATAGGPVVGLVGDLAFLHDVSALVRPATDGVAPGPALVVVDNNGGGIFDFLPQAAALGRDRFEQLFGTPQDVDVAEVAAGFNLAVADVATPEELRSALAEGLGRRELSVVRARVPDRRENVALHSRLHEAVAHAVGAALGGGGTAQR